MSLRTFRLLLSVFAVAAFALVVLGMNGCSSKGAATGAATSDTAAPQGSATNAGESAPSDSAQSTQSDTPEENAVYTPSYTPNGNEIAVIKTPKGTIKFKFYPKDAPSHVAAFIELAKKGFYDGTKFHRVEPGFVIQGGDPLSKTNDPMVGTGGPGYRLGAEFNSQKHLDGTVAMARSRDVDSAGSQFYICLGAQPMLDGQYTVFGQVVEGMDVVRSVQVGDVMESVTIEDAN